MTDSSAYLPHNRRHRELCGPGHGETSRRSPRWDPSAITGESSRPPHDAATRSYAPSRGASPRCYARCSEESLSDPGIRPRSTSSAGQPAPRCCKAPRPHRHPRPVCCWAMPATVKITGAPLTIEDSLAVANDAQVELAEGVRAKIADGPAVMDPGPRCRERRPRPHGPGRPRQGQQAGNRIPPAGRALSDLRRNHVLPAPLRRRRPVRRTPPPFTATPT
jgi:hypothetical protein